MDLQESYSQTQILQLLFLHVGSSSTILFYCEVKSFSRLWNNGLQNNSDNTIQIEMLDQLELIFYEKNRRTQLFLLQYNVRRKDVKFEGYSPEKH